MHRILDQVVYQVVLPKKRKIKLMDRVPIAPISRNETENTVVKEMDNDCNNAIALIKNDESMACELIAEEDEEFGSVVEVPLKQEEQVKEALSIDVEQIKPNSLAEQQEALLTLLNKYQGTNFTSSLTKKFLKMFGETPRFNTTGRPETADMIERWTRTFRKMIQHRLIIDNPTQWKYFPRIEQSMEKTWI